VKKYFFYFVLSAIILISIERILFPRSGEDGSGMEFLHIGSPAPAAFRIDRGGCGEIEEFVRPDGGIFQRADCGAPVGRNRFEVKCHNPDLPVAFVEFEVRPGDSGGVTFEHVCSSTAEEIHAENSRVRNEGHSARWSGRAALRSPAAATATRSQLPVVPPENSLKKPDSSRK
jgi:hypothetical protein